MRELRPPGHTTPLDLAPLVSQVVYGIPENSSVGDKNKAHRSTCKFSPTLRLAILIHPFGRFGGAERLAILHALGLTDAGHEVTLYTDTSLMHSDWLSMLGSKVQVRRLPYGL